MTSGILAFIFFAFMGALMFYQTSRPRYAAAKFLRSAHILVAAGLVLFGARQLLFSTEPDWMRIVSYVWAAIALALLAISWYRKEQNPNVVTLAPFNPSHKNGEEIG